MERLVAVITTSAGEVKSDEFLTKYCYEQTVPSAETNQASTMTGLSHRLKRSVKVTSADGKTKVNYEPFAGMNSLSDSDHAVVAADIADHLPGALAMLFGLPVGKPPGQNFAISRIYEVNQICTVVHHMSEASKFGFGAVETFVLEVVQNRALLVEGGASSASPRLVMVTFIWNFETEKAKSILQLPWHWYCDLHMVDPLSSSERSLVVHEKSVFSAKDSTDELCRGANSFDHRRHLTQRDAIVRMTGVDSSSIPAGAINHWDLLEKPPGGTAKAPDWGAAATKPSIFFLAEHPGRRKYSWR